MWGLLPIGSSILAIVFVLIPEKRRAKPRAVQAPAVHEELVLESVAL
jgi:hypothetical protein